MRPEHDHLKNTLQEIAIELTLLTGEVVKAALSDTWYDELHFPQGIIQTEIAHTGRWIFLPVRPAYLVSGTHVEYRRESITCSTDRTAKAIARDISRRLVENALEYWQACEKAHAKRLADIQRVNNLVERFKPYGCKSYHWKNSETQAEIHNDKAKLEISSYSGIWKMTIDQPTPEQAEKILQILGA